MKGERQLHGPSRGAVDMTINRLGLSAQANDSALLGYLVLQ